MNSSDCMKDAPLLLALLDYADQRRISLHMPGHQGGQAFPPNLRHRLAEIDATELAVTDDLNQPSGPAAEAMQAAAVAFGACETLFVTGGSTTALFAMITAFCPKGSKIIMPRAVHRSILNIAMLLDLIIVFIPIDKFPPVNEKSLADPKTVMFSMSDPLVPIPPPQAQAIQRILERHPDARAVLVTSPDYFGVCPDLLAIAEMTRTAGCPLLVDEAHGAHLCFSPQLLPPSALAAGASACVQSAHKTLPALTQGAYLHLGADFADVTVSADFNEVAGTFGSAARRPDRQHVRHCLSLYQTTSPSLMIGASLDYARAFMSCSGDRVIATTLEAIARFAAALMPEYRCTTADRWSEGGIIRDPLRVVIDVSETGYSGFELSDKLTRQGIDIEMADFRRLVMIPDLLHACEILPVVSDVLNAIVFEYRIRARKEKGITDRRIEYKLMDQAFYHRLHMPPTSSLRPESPFLTGKPVRRLPLTEAAGTRSADALIPYPPGIPLVWPGEILTQDTIEMLRYLLDSGFCLHGVLRGIDGECLNVTN